MLEMKNNSNKLEKVNESEVKLIIPDMVKNIMNHFEKYPTAKKISN
ncbi:unknown [Clostridium sp. CAG:470]|nr:unknown [Clostridium sp. CAG:470]